MKYHVYILKSLEGKHFYIGCTKDIKNRLAEHNNSKTKSTKPYIPWKVIYFEEFANKKEAYRREWFLKNPKGSLEKRKIIERYGEFA